MPVKDAMQKAYDAIVISNFEFKVCFRHVMGRKKLEKLHIRHKMQRLKPKRPARIILKVDN